MLFYSFSFYCIWDRKYFLISCFLIFHFILYILYWKDITKEEEINQNDDFARDVHLYKYDKKSFMCFKIKQKNLSSKFFFLLVDNKKAKGKIETYFYICKQQKWKIFFRIKPFLFFFIQFLSRFIHWTVLGWQFIHMTSIYWNNLYVKYFSTIYQCHRKFVESFKTLFYLYSV